MSLCLFLHKKLDKNLNHKLNNVWDTSRQDMERKTDKDCCKTDTRDDRLTKRANTDVDKTWTDTKIDL